MLTVLQDLISHMRWADGRIAEGLRGMPGAPANTRRLFAHVAAAEHLWWARIQNEKPRVAVWPALDVDEAASLGPALDCAIRHELNVHYLATGQRVPEDLHLANRQYLIHRAFKARTLSSPWQLDDSELAFAMSGLQSIQRESAVALG